MRVRSDPATSSASLQRTKVQRRPWYGPGIAALPCPVYQTSIVALRQRYFRDKPALEPAIHRALYLTLSLCAQNADLGDGTQRPENPAPMKTKHGLRTFHDRPSTQRRCSSAYGSASNTAIAARIAA